MTEYKENYQYITTQKELDEAVIWGKKQKYIVFDTETGPNPNYYKAWEADPKIGLDPRKADIYTFQFGNRYQQFIVDNRAELEVTGLVEILEDPAIGVLGVNLRFDTKFLMHHWNCIPTRLLDCMIMEQVIRCGAFVVGTQSEKKSMIVRKHSGMKALSERYLALDIDKDKDLRMTLWKTPMGQFDKRQLSYMAGDCIYPDLIARLQKDLIKERDLGAVIQLEHELIPVVANMELKGIPFNKQLWIQLMQEAYEELHKYEIKLDDFLGQSKVSQEDLFGESKTMRKYDYGSSQQMAKALDAAGIKGFRTQNGKLMSTSSDRIKLMKVDGRIDPALADAIMGYRVEKKKLESYGDNFLKAAHDLTGRIHPDFTQACLVTGRMSCSPGMQTIPRNSDYRAAFDSPPGYTLIVLDASQIEARISADLTNDEPAIRVFESGGDIYIEDGQRMFNREIIKGTPEGDKLRSRAKVCWLGLTYGQGKAKFNNYSRLFLGEDIPKSETDFLWDKFFEIHWQMKETMDSWSNSADPLSTNDYFYDSMADNMINPESARDSLLSIYMDRLDEDKAIRIVDFLLSRKDKVTYTSTTLGRKRLYRADYVGWWTAARNHPIQGTAADIQKATMVAFQQFHWENDFDADVINVVHDELVTLVREDQAEELFKEQKALGERVGQQYLTRVPMKMEGGITPVWTKDL